MLAFPFINLWVYFEKALGCQKYVRRPEKTTVIFVHSVKVIIEGYECFDGIQDLLFGEPCLPFDSFLDCLLESEEVVTAKNV